jgi:hypothetical protein
MEEEEKLISAPNTELLWEAVISDFKVDPDPVEYHSVLNLNDRRIILDIVNNHAVGFEALAVTNFNSYLFNRNSFKFNIHNEGFTDEIGKLFGMQDVTLGFKDFDERFIIKTNDESKVNALFQDANVRNVLTKLPKLSFGIVEYELEEGDGKAPFLELKIERAVNDPLLLKSIFEAFYSVLELVEK